MRVELIALGSIRVGVPNFGPRLLNFDVVGGNRGWYNTRPCKLYKAY